MHQVLRLLQQPRIVYVQLVAAVFAILAAAGRLPPGLDQERVVAIVMQLVAIAAIVERLLYSGRVDPSHYGFLPPALKSWTSSGTLITSILLAAIGAVPLDGDAPAWAMAAAAIGAAVFRARARHALR